MQKKRGFKVTGNPAVLLRLVIKHGMHWRYTPTFLIYLFKGLLFFPFYLMESLVYHKRISATDIVDAPVFIIGHHRSGTTLLHKLLTSDPRTCFFKNSDIIVPRLWMPGRGLIKKCFKFLLKKMKVESFAYNKVLFDLDDPQEEDMCLTGMLERYSFYWAFVFPKASEDFVDGTGCDKQASQWKQDYLYHLKRLQFFNPGKKLVLKNPPNMIRVGLLLQLFPEAKIIYIQRNPYDVIYSARRLWKKGLQAFSLQPFDDGLVQHNVFQVYKKFEHSFRQARLLAAPGNFIELSYEDLELDPSATVRRIYEKFGWNWERAREPVMNTINREKTYKKFKYRNDKALDLEIREELFGLPHNQCP